MSDIRAIADRVEIEAPRKRASDGWKFTERGYDIRYLDSAPLAGSVPHPAGDARLPAARTGTLTRQPLA